MSVAIARQRRATLLIMNKLVDFLKTSIGNWKYWYFFHALYHTVVCMQTFCIKMLMWHTFQLGIV